MVQHQPLAATDHPDALPERGPVFGLGITTGILGILASTTVFSLAGAMTMFALSGFPFIGLLAAVYWALAIAALVLGILTIVRNRQRSSTLPLSLLGIAVLVVVCSLAATFTGLTGGAWWILSTSLVPLIIVALLAYLSARKSSLQPVPYLTDLR